MDPEFNRALDATLAQATTPAATTVSTIVLQSHPLQLVVGLLRVSLN